LKNQADEPPLKVLFITYYWPPSGGAGVQRSLKFVKYLSGFNIHPTVITVKEQEASYAVLDPSLLEEVPAGATVVRTSTSEPFGLYKKVSGQKEVPLGGFANQNQDGLLQQVFKFIRGNLFIPDARVGWNRHVLQACQELLRTETFAAIITTSPPHSTQLIGLKLKKKYGLPWIADLRDPWTDIHYYDELKHTAPARALDQHYEKAVLEKADAVVVTNAETKRLFSGKPGKIDAEKITVITNGYDESDFQVPSAPPEKEFVITYTGTVSEDNNLEMFLRAFEDNVRSHPEIPFKLRFVGKVAAQVHQQLEKMGLLPLTDIIPFVPHAESIAYLMRSTMLLLGVPYVKHQHSNIPGKLFEYLAANKPVIGIGPIGSDVDQILDECGAGRVFHYSAYGLILDHLDLMSQTWKVNPNLDLPSIHYKQYSRRELTAQLAMLIREIAS
jgi:glycosyltransferase involved in cell wall biosynthesis